jgi:hypothetical protein
MKRKPRTLEQKVKRTLLKRLRVMEDTLGDWKAEALITWLMPQIEDTIARDRARQKTGRRVFDKEQR